MEYSTTMIKFKQLIECTTEFLPGGRRNGIDCLEKSKSGLLGISEDGDLFKYDYSTMTWTPFSSDLSKP